MLISGWLEFMFKSNCWWTPRYDWVWIRGISDCRTQQTTVPDTPHNEFRRKRRIPWSLLPWRKGQLQVTKERQAGQERNYMRYNHFFFFLICFIKARQLIPISIKLFRIEIKHQANSQNSNKVIQWKLNFLPVKRDSIFTYRIICEYKFNVRK